MPAVAVEYDASTGRIRKHFQDAYQARRFYSQMLKAGRNPNVRGVDTSNTFSKESVMAESNTQVETSEERVLFQFYANKEEAQAGKHKKSHRLVTVSSPHGPTLYAWAAPVAASMVVAKYAREHCGVKLDSDRPARQISPNDAENYLKTLPQDQLNALLARVAPETGKGKGRK
jgi:hypothetical protein